VDECRKQRVQEAERRKRATERVHSDAGRLRPPNLEHILAIEFPRPCHTSTLVVMDYSVHNKARFSLRHHDADSAIGMRKPFGIRAL
jgi:hypothetical protein